jgi:threonine/homoserine/homoserine lactone efflux protein
MFEAILKGLILGILLGISVGPVIFSIIKQSLNNGHRGGYAFIVGVFISDFILVFLCNIFTQIFNVAMEHELIIGMAGSGLLIVLGVYNFFFRKVQTADNGVHVIANLRKRDIAGIFFSGFFMNALNPGTMLFWFAATATITADSKSMNHPEQYRLIVFLTALLFNFSADFFKVLLANKIRNKLTSHNIHIINRISGAILILFGIVIVFTIFMRNAATAQV